MNGNDKIISYLQANKILSLKLDNALTALKTEVSNQINTTGAGLQRALHYTSCFTDEYQDVCQQQKTEDIRFTKGIYHLLQNGNIVCTLLEIYFQDIFKNKTSDQLENIKKMLIAVNVHIAASSLTKAGFALAVASSVAIGMNLSLDMSALAGARTTKAFVGFSLYGIVQKAADSAQRLCFTYPSYYSALYAQELEMMYFLIEPLFERANATEAQWATDSNIADIITRMIR
ncbi:hypothetical protein OMR58_18380 [Erwinia sp. INIA-01]|uniref:hypothetical protein n=1 Tax=Erwinia sp. INIA01 TaxID=2991500 RepID=UPI002224B4F4|nr:hypothetical protein [Erwinia sp. INIA01]MCW1876421.1 hypothetical protein [Erwinia sp. INIA01]